MKLQPRRSIVTLSGFLITLLFAGAPLSERVAANEPGLRHGDIFVSGVEASSPFWGFLGPRIIWRVRDGVKERYCQSSDALFFGVPEQMMVDSAGRIVFIAKVGAESFTGPRALFRCNGSAVERLAYFSRGSAAPPVFPEPFPNKAFNYITGLHLATVQTIEITPDHQRLITEDAYVMAMQEIDSQTGAVVETKVRRYRASTGRWDIAPDAAQWRDMMPAMVNHGGNTYSAAQNVLRRSTDPLRLEARGTIFDVDFELELAIFGGFKEVAGLIVDDSNFENPGSGCDPNLPSPPSLTEPRSPQGTYSVMSSFQYDIEYDGYGSLGLVLRSNSGGTGSPYLTNVSEALLNDNPADDIGEYFYLSTAGCAIYGSLKHTSIAPFFDPVTGQGNGVQLGTMATSPQGVVGMSGDSLVRVITGGGLQTIATGFVEAQSVAVYPAVVPPASGAVVIIRINSPVDVLVTDADGKRIGVDPATGAAINDFGENGFDSGPGEPRFLGIRNPTPGAFDLDTIGTGDGPFSIQVYSSRLGQPETDLNRISVSGTASTGVAGAHDFTLAADTTVAFVAPPPPVDSTPPAISGAVAGTQGNEGWYVSDAAVSWSVMDGESEVVSANGCDATVITTDTAGQTFACEASSAGGSASAAVTVKRDATPPTVTYSGQQAAYSLDQFVNIGCTASDAMSGLTSTTCANVSGPAYRFAFEANTFSAAAVDVAGNSASASVAFSVDVTYAGVCGLINRFVGNKGIANALCSKLAAVGQPGPAPVRAALLGAFFNHVQAQTSKALSDDQARILIGIAARLPK